jgi:multidrug efflux pump
VARFFIDRPIFAWVIAIIIMIAGVLSITQLGIEQYPSVAPPTVTVSATYPGASAEVVGDSVTQIIEQNMKGLDGLLYMSSTSESSGHAAVTLTFDSSTNPDIAQVQVQNQMQLAMRLLPQEVQRQGVVVSKGRTGFLNIYAFISTDGSMDRVDIADYVASNIVDPVSRVSGVGSVRVFGAKYAMRIWLDPNKLYTYRLAVKDVIAAIQAQNAQVAVGQIGGTPSIEGQQLNATISAQDRLRTADQFRQIVLRTNTDGAELKLGDVARVELGADSYDSISRYNGKPATGIAISLATGANALDTARRVSREIDTLKPFFPPGLVVTGAYDSTPFIRASIFGVVETLLEAIALVFLVMLLFLQNIRATLIPTIAVPVVLLGTFAALNAMGFTINMLTMFAMVLAIGLLVDDAIVVVENVERLMSEEGLSPLEATRKSMDQITGALVGIAMVLAAVFVPMGFLAGATGIIYRQFTATIVAAMLLSVFIAIVLTPALCATMLRPHSPGTGHSGQGFFGWFNRIFRRTHAGVENGVRSVLSRSRRYLAVFGVLVIVMGVLYLRLPAAFLPDEDQGLLMAQVTAPVGATQQRTLAVMGQVEKYFQEKETGAFDSMMAVQGFSFGGSGQNNGLIFVKLKHWDERSGGELNAKSVAGRATQALASIKDAIVFVLSPPAIPELGTSSGFAFFLQDNAGHGHEALIAARNQLLQAAAHSRLLAGVRPNGQEDAPQLRVDVNVDEAGALGLSIADVNQVLSAAWGGQYIDDFIDRGRVKRVYIQADAPYRMLPENFKLWSVRNNAGEMVPFAAFANVHWEYGSPRLERYNGVPSVEINGQGAPGVSSGDAMAEIESLAGQLPSGFGIAWTGLSFQEQQAGAQTPLLYTLSLLMVFLSLAALYESWSVPTAILLVAPLGILGAVIANTLRGMERDVYFQVAMLTSVGLSSKNAILIVEFAKARYESGMDLIAATLHAVRDRLRPILMTSFAFGLGVLPLAIATGAGSGAQRAIGTGVVGGMLFGTFLGLFFSPLFYVLIQRLAKGKRRAHA